MLILLNLASLVRWISLLLNIHQPLMVYE
jgi:hypothetical protein